VVKSQDSLELGYSSRPNSVRSRDGHMYMNRDVCKQGKPPAEVISRAQNDLFRERRCLLGAFPCIFVRLAANNAALN
jgi:hypothetical protein